jgi:hypothetical protein
LVSVMPARFDLAVELYVRPMDMPLINKGQKVRFMFDGWPSIVFSGWPNSSYGTFGGEVVAIDNFISPNGKYRILVAPVKDEQHGRPPCAWAVVHRLRTDERCADLVRAVAAGQRVPAGPVHRWT